MTTSNNQIKTNTCPNCLSTVKIFNIYKSHSFRCESCGSYLYWDADQKDIEANTELAKIEFEKFREKQKLKQLKIKHEYYIKKENEKQKREFKNAIFSMIIGFTVLSFTIIIFLIMMKIT